MMRRILHICCLVWLVMAVVPLQGEACVPARGMTLADSVASTMLRYCHPDDYVRACYRYGKILLNEQDNPVDAMKVFITASHVPTTDHIIMGRILSNIGTICRIANRHDLSHAIYQRSANCFLQAGDSTLYYYGLNNVAYESASLKDTLMTQILLDSIRKYKHPEVYLKTLETEMILYHFLEQNDSVISCMNRMQAHGYKDPTGLIMKAIAYDNINLIDSALFYARYVTATTCEPFYLISAYYILSHDDASLDVDSVLSITSNRADAQKEMTTRHGKLTQAVQLLEEDLNRKPDLGWLYAVIGTIFILSIGKRQNRLWIQKINSSRKKQEELVAQNEQIQQAQERRRTDMIAQIEEQCLMFQQTEYFHEILHWNDFQQLCEVINRRFLFLADKLKRLDLLNEQELRLCFLVLIGQFSDKQMADILNYSSKSIRTIKRNTAIKMNTTSKNLRTFLLEIVLK